MSVMSLRWVSSTLCRRSYYPWLIWSLGAAFFFSEYITRVSLGVMAPPLMEFFHVTALSFGTLSACFTLAYVGMQIPVGGLVDRFGPHRLLMLTTGACALGCFLFATSQVLWVAQLARFIMGFSAAFAFVGTLKLATVWFPAHRFGFLAGLTQAIGMLGAAVGEGPSSFGVSLMGWRNTTLVMGSVLFILALLIGLLVRDHPESEVQEKHRVNSSGELWHGFVTILKNPQTWHNGIYVGLLYAPTAAFAELWGPSFLVRTYGLSEHVAASAVGAIFMGWAVGGPITGWISDAMRRRKPMMIASAIASLTFLSCALYIPGLPVPLLFVLLFLYGVANTGVGTAYAVAGEINPKPVAGLSMSFANMTSVLVGAMFQPIIGWFLDLQWQGEMVNNAPFYTAHAFRVAMLALPICLLIATLFAFFVRETHCLRYGEE